MRRFLAIICFLLLTVQLLPIKSIGELLSKNAFTEEVAQNSVPNEVMEDHFGKTNFIDPHSLYGSILPSGYNGSCLTRHALLIHNCILPDSYKGDVFTPPPNC